MGPGVRSATRSGADPAAAESPFAASPDEPPQAASATSAIPAAANLDTPRIPFFTDNTDRWRMNDCMVFVWCANRRANELVIQWNTHHFQEALQIVVGEERNSHLSAIPRRQMNLYPGLQFLAKQLLEASHLGARCDGC